MPAATFSLAINPVGAHIAVAQQFLHGSDIRSLLKQMRRKAVPQRMHADMAGPTRFIEHRQTHFYFFELCCVDKSSMV